MYEQNIPELFHFFLEHTPVAVAMFDLQMRYIATSRRWLTDYGLKEQSLIGRSHYEVFPGLPERWKEIHQRCLQGAIESCEADSFTRIDGSVDWVKWEIRPWYDRNGNIGGIVFFTELITERVRTQFISDRVEAEEQLLLYQEKLEELVAERTTKLVKANAQLQAEINSRGEVEAALRQQAQQLSQALQELKRTQTQLVQNEKMSSLGQLVAGVSHEINNPVNFIYGNLAHAQNYTQDILDLLNIYQRNYSEYNQEIQEHIEAIDLDFVLTDLPKLMSSIRLGAERIRGIVRSLRIFSRLDEAEMKAVNIHEGIESALMILHNRFKAKPDRPAIEVIKNYGNLPVVECYAGQLNQVFMNLFVNAIDAIEEKIEQNNAFEPVLRISTSIDESDRVSIRIADNGIGMSQEILSRVFDPFFTTKPIGVGTGLGLSISYQIVVDKHGGNMLYFSEPGQGTEITIEIPLRQK